MCVARKDIRVRIGERSSAGGNHIGYATLEEADHVEVAFHDDDGLFVGNALTALVEPVKDVTLVVQRRFRAVHVFGALEFLVFAQVASTEGDYDSGQVLDGDHQTVAELIGNAPVFLFDGKSRFHTVQRRKTVLDGIADKAFSAFGGVADVEKLAGLVCDVAVCKIL